MLINVGDEMDADDTQKNNTEEQVEEGSVPSNTYEEIQEEQFKRMRQGLKDTDLDSLQDNGSVQQKNPNTVFVNDNASVNSSLTATTNNSAETLRSLISTNSYGTNLVSLSKPPLVINMDMIKDIAKGSEALTDDDLRRQVNAMQAHKYNDARVCTENLVKQFIQARKKNDTITVTPAKQKRLKEHHGSSSPESM